MPGNIVIAVVGDVKAATAIPMLEKYFGGIAAGPKPEAMTTIEPMQTAEKTVVIQGGDAAVLSWRDIIKPDYRDPDDAVYDAITDIVSQMAGLHGCTGAW